MSFATQPIAPTETSIPGFSEVVMIDSLDMLSPVPSPPSPRSPRSNGSRDTIPSEVSPGDTSSGVEEQSLELAKLFMSAHGQLARRCLRRGELSKLYISTQASWMPPTVQDNLVRQRPFKQILFALAHGLHVVRVVDGGRLLKWNRYRDDKGEKVEPHEDYTRSSGGRSPSLRRHVHLDRRDHRRDNRDRYDHREHAGGRDDHRDRYDRRERDNTSPARSQRYEHRR